MKLYVVDATEDNIEKLRRICSENGWDIRVMDKMGRPKANHPVSEVLDAYRQEGTIRGAARLLNLPPGTVHGILRREGVLTNKERCARH